MKEKAEKTEVQDGLTPAQRLESFILQYFRRQKTFADKVGLSVDAISKYVLGKTPITKKAATQMQGTTGINANWLLTGEGDMTIADIKPEYPVKYHGHAPIVRSKQEEKVKHRGMIKQLVIEDMGRKDKIVDNGEVNIMDRVIDGIEQPMEVMINSDHFRQKYNLKSNASFIVCSDYEDGDIVLAFDGKRYVLLEIDGDTKKDIANGQTIAVEDDNIFGSIFRKIEGI